MCNLVSRRYGLPTKIDNLGITAYEVWGDVALFVPPDGNMLLLWFQTSGSDHTLCVCGPSSYCDLDARNPYLYRLCLGVGKDWRIRESSGRCRT